METYARRSDLGGRERHNKPWLDGRPRYIFISDMGDSLSGAVHFDYLKTEIYDVVTGAKGSRHMWLWLTKKPGRMARFSTWLLKQGLPWPSNLWAGTSITAMDKLWRIPRLLTVGDSNTVRFLSVESQREYIDLEPWLPDLDWVIQGGQSASDQYPFDVEWARSMRDDCRKWGVPYFLKQLGSTVELGGRRFALQDSHGGDWSEWPEDLRVREMPQTNGVTNSGTNGRE